MFEYRIHDIKRRQFLFSLEDLVAFKEEGHALIDQSLRSIELIKAN